MLEAEPERAEAYNSLGYLVSRQGQARQAVAHYERAIEQRPEYPEAHFNLGLTLLQLGDYPGGFTGTTREGKLAHRPSHRAGPQPRLASVRRALGQPPCRLRCARIGELR